MADIALVFHWPLSELTQLTLPDLAMWHDKARARHPQQDET